MNAAPGAANKGAQGWDALVQVRLWSLLASQFDCAEQRGRNSLPKSLKVTL